MIWESTGVQWKRIEDKFLPAGDLVIKTDLGVIAGKYQRDFGIDKDDLPETEDYIALPESELE